MNEFMLFTSAKFMAYGKSIIIYISVCSGCYLNNFLVN